MNHQNQLIMRAPLLSGMAQGTIKVYSDDYLHYFCTAQCKAYLHVETRRKITCVDSNPINCKRTKFYGNIKCYEIIRQN